MQNRLRATTKRFRGIIPFRLIFGSLMAPPPPTRYECSAVRRWHRTFRPTHPAASLSGRLSYNTGSGTGQTHFDCTESTLLPVPKCLSRFHPVRQLRNYRYIAAHLLTSHSHPSPRRCALLMAFPTSSARSCANPIRSKAFT